MMTELSYAADMDSAAVQGPADPIAVAPTVIALRNECESLRNDLEHERQSRIALQRRYDELGENVRDVAYREMENGRWCRAGMNETLQELGLAPFVSSYSGTVTVELEVTLDSVGIADAGEADSRCESIVDDAVRRANTYMDGSLSIRDWSVSSDVNEDED